MAAQSVDSASVSASATSSSLARLRLLALRVEGGEVGAAAAGEAVPGGREPLPQLAVGLLVDAADGLPLVEDLLEPVAGRLPAGRLGRELLGLLDQRGLAGQRLGAGGLAGGARLAGLLLGDRGELVEPGGEAVDVADDVRLGERAAQPPDRGQRVRGVGRTGLEPGLDQVDLGHQVGEAPGEVGQALLGRPGLPGTDDPLALGRLDVHGAVRVHPSEGRPVAHLPILVLPAPSREVARRPPPQRSHVLPGIVTGRYPVRVERLFATVTIR